MPQVVDPTLVALVNARGYAALQTPRRNSGNTAYEWAAPAWTDQTYSNPGWISSLAYSKLTGTPTIDALLPSQTGQSGKYLTTNGSVSSWGSVSVPSAANPSASVGLAAVNGTAATFLRSDGAPALDQTIAPTMSGAWVFSANGAASTPTLKVTGSPYSAGTATTNFPLAYLNESTATASTSLSTSGTYFAINAHANNGDFINLMKDGVSNAKIATSGAMTFSPATNVQMITMSNINGADQYFVKCTSYLSSKFCGLGPYGGVVGQAGGQFANINIGDPFATGSNVSATIYTPNNTDTYVQCARGQGGNLYLTTDTLSTGKTVITVAAVAGNIAGVDRGAASQSADLRQWQKSDGTRYLSVGPTGIIQTSSGNESTGAGSAALGANSPAVTNTAPYTWLTFKSSDGSTVYIPAWK